jgi:hypothetical protein
VGCNIEGIVNAPKTIVFFKVILWFKLTHVQGVKLENCDLEFMSNISNVPPSRVRVVFIGLFFF